MSNIYLNHNAKSFKKNSFYFHCLRMKFYLSFWLIVMFNLHKFQPRMLLKINKFDLSLIYLELTYLQLLVTILFISRAVEQFQCDDILNVNKK